MKLIFFFVFLHVQTTQAGGGTAVLRAVCRGSAGPGGLVVPCGAPAGGRPACPWRSGPGVQSHGLTQGKFAKQIQTRNNCYNLYSW